ncbi:chromosome segregation protein SMC [Fructobacillus sp. M1-13]|uniref:Chromosome partition protein Smc n=1 Tax=Fructobacillus papyriferae TaxID=2713171 RepID=A0ABS5QP11_9LACO|nr:chromosome segregation protein SMC [Fructobacillus papyriferae]MBS9334866.1 chromosome segregation protein SMC [Fructobacillus papyriferae]MCD2158856.1 chromosome segregation protein SMC [Fructobacillus papyriferae]
MKLKTLEIIGFKSFANKTVIDFQQGMTGIVGPNGSGKSNIIEAIRWVMGEQSAKDLRGNKMADVIFAGTKDRKPVNRAEVSITFDNSDHYIQSDFSELRITRRLYRSGESSYQLNGAECRLKDIHEIFMDTGLGRDGFSIISQGQVEKIFSAKPEERRGIIEEVAGVYKYKQNKSQAEKDLAVTDDNLDRVADIVHEVEGRLTPLEKQAETAKDYLEKRENYEKLDQVRLTRSILSLQEQVVKDDSGLKELNAAVEGKQGELAEQKEGLGKARTQLSAVQENKDQLAQDILSKTQQKEQLIGNQKLASQEAESLQHEAESLTKQFDNLQEQGQQAAEDLATADSEEQTLSAKDQELKKTIQQIEKEHGQQQVQRIKNELEENRQAYVSIMQELAALHNKVTFEEKALQQNQEQKERKLVALQEAKAARQVAQNELAAYQQEHPDQTTGENPYEARLTSAKDQLSAAKNDYQKAQAAWQEAAYALDKAQSVYQAESALDEYAGFYQGVKNLMVPAVKRNFPGIRGVVAELVDVPKQYTKAIETVLGGALQNVVVDSTKTAKSIVNYLTKNRKGRVTLLPEESIKPRSARDIYRAEQEAGFIGVAADLVTMPKKMDNILSNLLGTTLVVQDLDAATRVARAVQNRMRVVSLDGQLVNAGGSITGGANHRQGPSVLSRQAELKERADALAKQEGEVKDLQQKRNEQQNLVNELSEQVQELSASYYDFENQGQQVDYKLTALKDVVEKEETRVQTLTLDLADLKAAEEDSVQEQQDSKQALLEKESAQKEAEAKSADLADRLAQVEEEQTAYQEEKAQFQAEAATVAAKLEAADANKKRLQALLSELQNQQNELSNRQDEINKRLEQAANGPALSAQLEQLKEELEQAGQHSNELTQRFSNLTEKVSQMEAALSQKQEEVNQAMMDQANATHRLQAGQEKLAKQMATLQQTYGLTVESQADLKKSDLPDQAIDQQLAQLKRALAALGPVNVAAIQEYEEIKERHSFLTKQAEDLQQAKATLQATIDEMDQEVQVRFKQTFDQVAEHFKDVFTKMFAGGQAQIELTDPKHLLTTGIDIKAQPPGKKFQQMSLLSGGEKALTAISLLFAILQVRPVPFAVLDEAEAALDEANVDRFAAYLKNFGGSTQFITITHRKGTMVAASVLYGVTMQEAGVSKMVAVNLEQAEEKLA